MSYLRVPIIAEDKTYQPTQEIDWENDVLCLMFQCKPDMIKYLAMKASTNVTFNSFYVLVIIVNSLHL